MAVGDHFVLPQWRRDSLVSAQKQDRRLFCFSKTFQMLRELPNFFQKQAFFLSFCVLLCLTEFLEFLKVYDMNDR